jgi:hypothetical protein
MIHHTILPDELIWEGFEQLQNKVYDEIQIGHITMVIEKVSPTEARIIRLISPNPQDYTISHLAPGSKIRLEPTFTTEHLSNTPLSML